MFLGPFIRPQFILVALILLTGERALFAAGFSASVLCRGPHTGKLCSIASIKQTLWTTHWLNSNSRTMFFLDYKQMDCVIVENDGAKKYLSWELVIWILPMWPVMLRKWRYWCKCYRSKLYSGQKFLTQVDSLFPLSAGPNLWIIRARGQRKYRIILG